MESHFHKFNYIICGASGCTEWMNVPAPCGNRFCNVCQSQRRARTKRRMQQMIAWQQKHKQPSSRFKFVTLTLIRQTDLRKGIAFLLSSFRRLRQQNWWKNKVHGGIFVVECVNKEDGWHVHLHAVIYGRYIPQKKLSDAWQKLTGAIVVWVEQCHPKEIVSYLSKYLTKGNSNDQETQQAGQALKGIRLFQPFGCWHNCTPAEQREPAKCGCCGSSQWQIISFGDWMDPRTTVRSRHRYLQRENIPSQFAEIEVNSQGVVRMQGEVIYTPAHQIVIDDDAEQELYERLMKEHYG